MNRPRDVEAFFLVGPTAVGKSAVAHCLAEQQSATILSADSMLIYRGMDIGTAKPSVAERGDVPYYGVDLADPDEDFSVWDYRHHALEALAKINREDALIVTGGTGLYVKSLIHGLTRHPGADKALRVEWERRLANESIEALQEAVRQADPVRYEMLSDKENPRRLIRALETAGTPPDEKPWQSESDPVLIGLSMEPHLLNARIAQRVEDMYAQGLVEEVSHLLVRERPLSKTASQAIGYAEVIDLIEGRATQAEAVERTIVRTRRLAKRQRTWFRHQANVIWVDVAPESSVTSLAEQVAQRWREYGSTPIRGE